MIIDTHQHLWDLSKVRLLWAEPGSPLARNHAMSDYLAAAVGLGITKTIYMEVDVEPADHDIEAQYVLDLCRRDDNPVVGAVIGGRPASEGFEAYARRYAREPEVKGIREVLHGWKPAGLCLQPEYVRGVRLLGELGLRFDLCMRPGELADGAKLAELCPDTQLILDHCGNGEVQSTDRSTWQRGMEQIAARPNVVCKISGIVAGAKPGAWGPEDLAPIIEFTADAFGRDRIVFASDWPVCTQTATLRQWVQALQQIVAPWPAEDRAKLFHANATRTYNL